VGTRANAAQELGKLEEQATKAIPKLITAMAGDVSARVRGRAALALGRIGDQIAVKPLISTIEEDKDAKVRSRAAWALGQLGDNSQEVISALKEAAERDENKERLFYYLYSWAILEGKNSDAVKRLQEMKEKGEMERWNYVRFDSLCKELDIKARVKEAEESIETVKAGAQSVEGEVQTLRKAVEKQPEGKVKQDLMNITMVLQKMIDSQQKTIERQEETIKGLNQSLADLVKAHQKSILEPRLTADQLNEIKEKEFQESWFRRNIIKLLGAFGTLAGGVAAILGWIF
jgi:hypothetical protein